MLNDQNKYLQNAKFHQDKTVEWQSVGKINQMGSNCFTKKQDIYGPISQAAKLQSL